MSTTKVSALDQLLLDVFSTAMEGGIRYWCSATSYHWFNDGCQTGPEEDYQGFYADIIIDEDAVEEDEEAERRIDRSVMAKGYRLATSTDWRLRLRWSTGTPPLVVGPDTDWDYDAGDADMIVQLGLFEDVRYG